MAGMPAMARLQELVQAASDEERELHAALCERLARASGGRCLWSGAAA